MQNVLGFNATTSSYVELNAKHIPPGRFIPDRME